MDSSPVNFIAFTQQYRRCLADCRQLEAKSSFLRQRIVQLRGEQDPRIRAVIPVLNGQLRQLSERIRQEDSRMAAVALAMGGEISKLRDERLEQVLRCRYLELMTWEEISQLTGLGLRWLHRLHKKGMGRIGG